VLLAVLFTTMCLHVALDTVTGHFDRRALMASS
jgi:hypothetical protein